jgi:hypothetical protein
MGTRTSARGSAETKARIEEYWGLGCKVPDLPGNDTPAGSLYGAKFRRSPQIDGESPLADIGARSPERTPR